MATAGSRASTPVTVVVGVDGTGRTHRLERLAAGAGRAIWLEPAARAGPHLDRLLEVTASTTP